MKTLLLVVLLLAVLGAAPGSARAASPGSAVWPLQPAPVVVNPFDPPDDRWGPGHRGVDLLGTPGQEVHAALAGTVSFAGTLAGRGVVVVDHGATRTTYEPVAATVTVGQPVATGAVIGTLQFGMSHCFPRTCLHWGLLRGEVPRPALAAGGRAGAAAATGAGGRAHAARAHALGCASW
jgi:murein DD-endopeptidase MepM/ murein hydrolase activator NlpD